MPYDRLVFSDHANERFHERGVRRTDVQHVLGTGEVLRAYPEDTPYPSYLMLGWVEGEGAGRWPLHVVAADADELDVTFVITAYQPDPNVWTDDFRRKVNDE